MAGIGNLQLQKSSFSSSYQAAREVFFYFFVFYYNFANKIDIVIS